MDFGVVPSERAKPERTAEASRHDLLEGLKGFAASIGPQHASALVIPDDADKLSTDDVEGLLEARIETFVDQLADVAVEVFAFLPEVLAKRLDG